MCVLCKINNNCGEKTPIMKKYLDVEQLSPAFGIWIAIDLKNSILYCVLNDVDRIINVRHGMECEQDYSRRISSMCKV